MTYTTDLGLYIDGKWRRGEGRDTHKVVNPATGETLAELPLATSADLDEALAATARGFATWRKTDVNERAGILHKVAGLIRERAEDIAVLLTTEQGKPLAKPAPKFCPALRNSIISPRRPSAATAAFSFAPPDSALWC